MKQKNENKHKLSMLETVFAILIIVGTIVSEGYLFILFLILAIIFKLIEVVGEKNFSVMQAYNSAFIAFLKLILIIILILVVSFGVCSIITYIDFNFYY